MVAFLVGIASIAAGQSSLRAASGTTVVTATVPSATTLDAAGCPSREPGITSFGVVLPGEPAVTSADCSVSFGSSNDTSSLRLVQSDGVGQAMFREAFSAQVSGIGSDLRAVRAIDASTAIAVGWGGTILKTTDGGTTWSPRPSGTLENLTGIEMTSATVGYVSGFNGTVRRTTDAGETWTGLATGTSTNLWGLAASPTDPQVLWAVGDGGVVIASTDGGASWGPQATGATSDLYRVEALDSSQAWIVGAGGTILSTSDGGSAWTLEASGTAQLLWHVQAVDASTLWIVGNNGTLLNSTDGGATWTPMSIGATEDLRGLRMVDATTFWITGYGGVAYKSIDGGATWQTRAIGTTSNLQSTSNFAGHVAWAVGASGTIVKIGGEHVSDHDPGTNDWTSGTEMFGACLRAVGGSAVGSWTVDGDGDCTASNGDPWMPVAPATGDAGATVASAPTGTTTATASLRFGFRAAPAQAPGTYEAPVTFDVAAPGV